MKRFISPQISKFMIHLFPKLAKLSLKFSLEFIYLFIFIKNKKFISSKFWINWNPINQKLLLTGLFPLTSEGKPRPVKVVCEIW